MKSLSRIFLVCVFFALFNGLDCSSQEHQEKNHISVFPAYTVNYKGKEGVKFGLEYERRINDVIGVGGTFDFTGKDYDNYAVSAGVTFKPFKFGLIGAVGLGAKSYFDKELGRAWKTLYSNINCL